MATAQAKQTIEADGTIDDLLDGAEIEDHASARDSLQVYLNSMEEHPLLGKYERSLFRYYVSKKNQLASSQGKEKMELESEVSELREDLIAANLKFVVVLAKKYRSRAEEAGMSFLDLISEGNTGLIKAVDKYDPDHQKQAKFSSHASWWIKQAMNSGIMNYGGRAMRFPVKVQLDMYHMSTHIADEAQRLGRPPTSSEIVGNNKKYEGLLAYLNQKAVSLDQPMNHDESRDGGSAIGNVIVDQNANVYSSVQYGVMEQELRKALHWLSKKRSSNGNYGQQHKRVLEMRFGLGSKKDPMTLDAVAAKMDLSHERVRQIQNHALKLLRYYFVCVRDVPGVGELTS